MSDPIHLCMDEITVPLHLDINNRYGIDIFILQNTTAHGVNCNPFIVFLSDVLYCSLARLVDEEFILVNYE